MPRGEKRQNLTVTTMKAGQPKDDGAHTPILQMGKCRQVEGLERYDCR
jgi:hypothetical protein